MDADYVTKVLRDREYRWQSALDSILNWTGYNWVGVEDLVDQLSEMDFRLINCFRHDSTRDALFTILKEVNDGNLPAVMKYIEKKSHGR